MISNLTLTTRTKNRSKRIFLKKKIKKIAAIRNELMMNSNKMNTQNFGEIPDITEDQAKAILTTATVPYCDYENAYSYYKAPLVVRLRRN